MLCVFNYTPRTCKKGAFIGEMSIRQGGKAGCFRDRRRAVTDGAAGWSYGGARVEVGREI